MKTTILFLTISLLAASLTGCAAASKTYFEDAIPSAEESTEQTGQTESPVEETESQKECYLYICGAVNSPGVYMLPAGSRIYDAVLQAGGLSEDASESSINLAEEVVDGQMIQVPTVEEAANQQANTAEAQEEAQGSDGRINLNTATISELMTLPGIGESKAKSILSYREETGGFASAEEIMNITGIKDGVYSKIKDYITVN